MASTPGFEPGPHWWEASASGEWLPPLRINEVKVKVTFLVNETPLLVLSVANHQGRKGIDNNIALTF